MVRHLAADRSAGQRREKLNERGLLLRDGLLHAWLIDLYTPIFAVSRMSGWTAHILEQYANNRLIRPRADYTGPSFPQRFVPLEQR